MCCGHLWSFSLAVALELLPKVVRRSAISFAHCGQSLATGCVGSVVALRDVVLIQLLHWVTHDYLFFVVVIFLGLPHFWTPLGVPRWVSLEALCFEAS